MTSRGLSYRWLRPSNANTCPPDDTTRNKRKTMYSWSDVLFQRKGWVLSSAIVVISALNLFLSSFLTNVFLVLPSFAILGLPFFSITIAARSLSILAFGGFPFTSLTYQFWGALFGGVSSHFVIILILISA